MSSDSHHIDLKYLLSPFAFLYGMGVRIRNQLFNWGVLPMEQYDVPVICIGNLAVGGTGKTPHIEYVVRLLRRSCRVAVLSRGYKRKTKGFVLATAESTSADIGDEPFQIKKKFPAITVAVDANRRRGIKTLLALPEKERPEVILLDDGFQHRYVIPSLSILLTDYQRLYYEDMLMPVGRLREPIQAVSRADIVIVTKCEQDLKPIEYRIVESRMGLRPHHALFVTRVRYGDLRPVFPEGQPRVKRDIRKNDDVLVFSGIAHPESFEAEIRHYSGKVQTMSFPDHHDFTQDDILKIDQAFNQMSSQERLLIVTEKDAARLYANPYIPAAWKTRLYALPIEIEFHGKKEPQFNELIIKHIAAIQQNGVPH